MGKRELIEIEEALYLKCSMCEINLTCTEEISHLCSLEIALKEVSREILASD